jgi:exoribonuclease R
MRTPLLPPLLSEGAASLLPGEVRPAFVWDMTLDGAGTVTSASVARARVRSTQRLDYEQAQARSAEPLRLLAEIGQRRIALERARGGAELQMPEQEVEATDAGYHLRFRPQLDSEDHNAQISLMTGMAAAKLMLDGGVGVLRTMPPPEDRALRRLRRQARALGIDWPDGLAYGEFLRSLDRTRPAHLALVHASRSLFRGAGYAVLPAEQITHASIAAPYAHVTAPLRRLVDRFALLVCAALSAGEQVPADVRAALTELPDLMREADRRAGSVERACTDAVEAAVLAPRVGETFDAVAVDDNAVQILDPAVLAAVEGKLEPGKTVRVTLVEADVRRRVVRFAAS